MIEIFLIIISFVNLFIFSNFPINYFQFKNQFNVINFSFNDVLLVNLLFNFNLLLVFSLFPINMNLIFFLILFYTLFFFIKFQKQYIELFKKNFLFSLSCFIIFYSISMIIIKNAYLEYDALAHWIYKVKIFYQGGSIENLKNIPFDYYPHLGSYIWAFFWKNSWLEYEYLGRLFFIFIFLICVFKLSNQLNNTFSKLQRILIVFVITFFSTNTFLFGGYQEYLLFFCFYCFSNFFLKINNLNNYYKKNIIPELIILLILNIFIWVKQEGLFYFFILNFIFILHAKRSIKNRFIFCILSLFLFLFYWLIKNYYFDTIEFNDSIINSETFKNLNISYLFSKILIITKYFVISFVKYPIWLVIFLSIFILKFTTNYFEKNKFIYTYLVLTFSFVYAIFLNTPDNLTWLLPITLNRLVFTLSGFLIFLIPVALNNIKIKSL